MINFQNNGLHHVGYVVRDLEKTIGELEKTMGKLSYQKYDFKPMNAWYNGKKCDVYQLKIAMITLADNKTCIEVIEPVSEGYHMDYVNSTNGGGINHICIAVEGMYDDVRKAFEENNAKFVFESETEDDIIGYRRCFYAEDVLGNVFEVKENPYFRDK